MPYTFSAESRLHMVKYSNFIVWVYLQYNLSYSAQWDPGFYFSEISVKIIFQDGRKNGAVEAGIIFACFVHCMDVRLVQEKSWEKCRMVWMGDSHMVVQRRGKEEGERTI